MFLAKGFNFILRNLSNCCIVFFIILAVILVVGAFAVGGATY